MLEGEIREINLVERLVELWRQQFTGALRFEHDGIIKIIYFKGGDVLSASTNDRADSVDEILMKAGKVSKEHVKQALAKRKENETLGDALLILGFITRKELTWGRRMQVISVIRTVSEWQAGSFTIVENYLPKREEGTIFSLPQLIVEMTVTETDRTRFERALESGSVVLDRTSGFDESFKSLGLNEEAEAVVRNVDGLRSASEVAAVSGQETFNAFKLMHALTLLGFLQRRARPAPLPSDDFGFENAGVADAADAWVMPQFQTSDAPAPTPQETIEVPAPPPPPSQMPAWELPQPAPPAKEPEWGFDDAQIDAAKTVNVPVPASIPALAAPIPSRPKAPPGMAAPHTLSQTGTRRPAPPPPKRSRFGLLLALMVVFILAGVAYGAFLWWNGQKAVPPIASGPEPVPTTTVAQAPVPVVTEGSTTIAPTELVPATATAASPPAPPPTVVTPTGAEGTVASPAGDLRVRYDAMAREFAQNPIGNFAVQFAIMCEPSSLTNAIRGGGAKVWFVPISLRGRSCYRVFWGRYESREAAAAAMGEIPANLRGAASAVVPVPR
ncbi:MAG TPA: DUF4388 domain-containing protein [Thermoanaerobaculia bacterium]|nr:DUF4388 domain-containing protein [Thermoanaerobaculia bacterium]